MAKPTVHVDRLGKKFGLSLRNALKYGLIDTARRGLGLGKSQELRDGEFWALSDVSFSLQPGDSLGLMGVNGSGKTTMLRILNGTYSPDRGKATLRGRVGALIAAGAGFSPLLTGRENVFVCGALLGMKSAEIRKRFDEIVAFAELEDFIDMPARNYSSGMSVRLGFSVAVLGAPDILLVDEVLAVGDISFQKKCFERVQALKEAGSTIILVSHAPGSIWAICNKGLVLHHGVTQGVVSVEDACRSYDHFNACARMGEGVKEISSSYNGLRCGTGEAWIHSFEVLDHKDRQPNDSIPYGDSFVLRMRIFAKERIEDAIVRIAVDSEIYKAFSIIDNYESSASFLSIPPGESELSIVVRDPNLRPGLYSLTASIGKKSLGVHLFLEHNIKSFMVKHPEDRFFYADFRSMMHLESEYEYHHENDR